MSEPTTKPCYCLGRNTILQVATEGQLQTDHVDFVAADDLFHQDPYVQIAQLTKERDEHATVAAELAVKCDELQNQLERLAGESLDMVGELKKVDAERDQHAAKCAEMRDVLSRWENYMTPIDENVHWSETFSPDFLRKVKYALSDQCGADLLAEKAKLEDDLACCMGHNIKHQAQKKVLVEAIRFTLECSADDDAERLPDAIAKLEQALEEAAL